jgi:hypothetical protein
MEEPMAVRPIAEDGQKSLLHIVCDIQYLNDDNDPLHKEGLAIAYTVRPP